MNWYFQALANYFNFADRARRKEYWMFVLFNMIVMIAVGVIDGVLGGFGIVSGLYALGVFIPGLAVTVRRLHDTGRSGWWFLISIIPFLGIIVLIYFMVLEGHAEANEYGVNPKTVAA